MPPRNALAPVSQNAFGAPPTLADIQLRARTYPRPAPLTLAERLQEFQYGLGEGLGQAEAGNLEFYHDVATRPVGVYEDLVSAAKAVGRDPSIVWNTLKQMGQQAASGPRGLGEVVGGFVNPRNFLRNMSQPNVLDIYKIGDKVLSKDGRRGTIVSVRRLPEKDLSAWEAKRKELHNQAFQGYLAGQHTFDQSAAIFEELLKRNEDVLQHLYKKSSNRLTEVPKVLFEGESRPKSLFESDIETHFSGPSRK